MESNMKKMISVLPVLFVLFLSTSCQKDPDMSKLDDNFMVYTDYDKKENFKGIKSNKEKTNNRKVIDKDTNKIYNSIIECAKDKGINYKTLQANISGTRKKNRFNIEYY